MGIPPPFYLAPPSASQEPDTPQEPDTYGGGVAICCFPRKILKNSGGVTDMLGVGGGGPVMFPKRPVDVFFNTDDHWVNMLFTEFIFD